MGRGLAVDLGPMARLRIGGIDVLVVSERQQVLDDEVFLLHGIDVRRYTIVALKSSAHFRAGYASLAKAIIAADAPGATTLRWTDPVMGSNASGGGGGPALSCAIFAPASCR